ncbi:AcrR family transcriptional regulator [Actinomadura coerulea]|uniref:AcrR family transcriptional regulator n=1 Tax=Actinomadura coerulea TaxID=46159 RepID=A0A7X0G7I8_9ACTN|nr:TetR/AcrR family transcriptional regulator [Actinomadura coerulea]MBB6399716.1 AcrR family transcriptional regulator [Actinomadura coerulea]GGQ11762.1 TetR family transcriptional regulator [Actinomadura coerulea]
MGAKQRPLRADARDNRDRILAAAREVFVEQGPGAPLEEISRRAGTGIATLYRRFPDRRTLTRAVALDALERTRDELKRARDEERTAFDALVRYMHRVLDIRIGAVFPVLLDQIPFDDEEIAAARDEGAAVMKELVAAAQENGDLRPDVTHGDVGMLLVRLSRPLPGPPPRDTGEDPAHRHLDLLIDGLRAGRPGELGGTAPAFGDPRSMGDAPGR